MMLKNIPSMQVTNSKLDCEVKAAEQLRDLVGTGCSRERDPRCIDQQAPVLRGRDLALIPCVMLLVYGISIDGYTGFGLGPRSPN
jgi:hypothetical protein